MPSYFLSQNAVCIIKIKHFKFKQDIFNIIYSVSKNQVKNV